MKILLALVLLGGVAQAQLRIGDPARALELPDLDGKVVHVEELRGRVAAIDFFATWCGPCHQALAALEQIARAEPSLTLIIVDEEEAPEVVRAFFAAHPTRARVLLDRHGEAGRRYGERRLPTTFVIDPMLVVRHINRGYGPGYPARMAGWIRALLST